MINAAPTPIVFICDKNYVMPTAIAINSLKSSKALNTQYHVFIVSVDLSVDDTAVLSSISDSCIRLDIIEPSRKFDGLHASSSKAILVATEAALQKFDLANIISEYDRVIYLDGDVIVREDISTLLQTELEGKIAAVVSDSGQIYFKHDWVRRVGNYFNSGVMVLDLKSMRELRISEQLVEAKKKIGRDNLMDQNAFNLVLDGKVSHLPIRYNFLCVNLSRARHKYSINDINQLYGTQYSSLEEAMSDAAIVHFSSKDKPWIFTDVPFAELWWRYYLSSPFGKLSSETEQHYDPVVSVIVPAHNMQTYLPATLDSILHQVGVCFELICVDDGSTDRSLAILEAYRLRYPRLRVITQPNKGQSQARNRGLQSARGKYVYFLDGDGLLSAGALRRLIDTATQDSLDVLFFDGEVLFEEGLEHKYPNYIGYYRRRFAYGTATDGPALYSHMARNGDFRASPCSMLLKKSFLESSNIEFYEGVAHEDNLFALKVALRARRAAHINDVLFHHRVRSGSIMTPSLTSENVKGYVACAAQGLREVILGHLSEEAKAGVNTQITGWLKVAARIFDELGDAERAKVRFGAGSVEDLLFELLDWKKGTQLSQLISEAESCISRGEYAAARKMLRQALAMKDDRRVRRRLAATNKYWIVRTLSFSRPLAR